MTIAYRWRASVRTLTADCGFAMALTWVLWDLDIPPRLGIAKSRSDTSGIFNLQTATRDNIAKAEVEERWAA